MERKLNITKADKIANKIKKEIIVEIYKYDPLNKTNVKKIKFKKTPKEIYNILFEEYKKDNITIEENTYIYGSIYQFAYEHNIKEFF